MTQILPKSVQLVLRKHSEIISSTDGRTDIWSVFYFESVGIREGMSRSFSQKVRFKSNFIALPQ